MENKSGRVSTRQHYEAIIQLQKDGEERERRLGGKIDKGFQRVEGKLESRLRAQDDRIDNIANWEKVIGIVAMVWPALAAALGARYLPK